MRVAALVFEREEVALIHRASARGEDLYSIPGGNVEPTEPLEKALERELAEELGLDLSQVQGAPRFTWLMDSMVSRPGAGAPPRKVHLVYRVYIDEETRKGLSDREWDDVGGDGEVVWLPFGKARGLHLFPPVPLAELGSPEAGVEAGDAHLAGLDDSNYRWI